MKEFIPAIELIDECQNSCLEYLKNKYIKYNNPAELTKVVT